MGYIWFEKRGNGSSQIRLRPFPLFFFGGWIDIKDVDRWIEEHRTRKGPAAPKKGKQ